MRSPSRSKTMPLPPPARALKLGQAISELIRRSGADRVPLKQVDGVWVFDLPADAPPITAQQVAHLLDESA
jgi:hypothetical protein